jgi:hypothetical protein
MEPSTAGSIVAVCDCCPALQPLSEAAAIITQIAAAAEARGRNEFTVLSDRPDSPAIKSPIRATSQFSFLKAIGASCDGSKRLRQELIRQAEEVFSRPWETYQSVGVGSGAARITN